MHTLIFSKSSNCIYSGKSSCRHFLNNENTALFANENCNCCAFFKLAIIFKFYSEIFIIPDNVNSSSLKLNFGIFLISPLENIMTLVFLTLISRPQNSRYILSISNALCKSSGHSASIIVLFAYNNRNNF